MAKATVILIQPNYNIPTSNNHPFLKPHKAHGHRKLGGCAEAKGIVGWIHMQQNTLAHGHMCEHWDVRAS